MKRFCILMSIVVVNVLAANLANYKREIAITNKQIKLVISHPEVNFFGVFKNLVRNDEPMEKIAIMFAVPAMVIHEKISVEELRQYINYQTQLQDVIISVLGIADSDVNDKNIDNPDVKDESIDDSDVKGKKIDISDVEYKSDLRTAINTIRSECESMDFEACNLSELGDARKLLLLEDIEKIIYGVARKSDFDASDVKDKTECDDDFKCRIKGIYRSVHCPEFYVKEAKVDGEWCILTDINNNEIKR